MLTVTNNLATHLIIPGGLVTGKSLILRPKGTPKGTVQVEASTGPLRDAERNGHVAIHGSGSAKEPEDDSVRETPAAGVTDRTDTENEEKEELHRQILALVDDGKTQEETAQALGTNRNVVQKALRQAGMERRRSKKQSKKRSKK